MRHGGAAALAVAMAIDIATATTIDITVAIGAALNNVGRGLRHEEHPACVTMITVFDYCHVNVHNVSCAECSGTRNSMTHLGSEMHAGNMSGAFFTKSIM